MLCVLKFINYGTFLSLLLNFYEEGKKFKILVKEKTFD